MTEDSALTNQPNSIADLEPKMCLQGTVKAVRLHGAVIDVGLACEGLLHISQLAADDNINRVADVVQLGDNVTVWVTKVHPEQNRISLTMVEPPDVDWNELTEGQTCSGTVMRIESYGAFVDIGAERPGLLHIREMSSGYIAHPSELVSIGGEVDVRVLKVDRRRRRIDLTMMGLEAEAETEPEEISGETAEEAEESSRTSMEIALLRAYADQGEEEESKPRPEDTEKRRQTDFSERQEILARTIEQHSE